MIILHHCKSINRATRGGEKTAKAWLLDIKITCFIIGNRINFGCLTTPKTAGLSIENYITLQSLCNEKPRDANVEAED